MDRIKSDVTDARAARGVKAGKSFAVSSRLSHHISGKAANPISLKDARLPFDLLETKLTKLAPTHRQTKFNEVAVYEVRSEKIAELLNLSKSRVEVIRKKLRDSGLDVSLLNANYIEASRKNSGKRAVGSKPPRGN